MMEYTDELREEFKQQTLAWCNQMRQKFDMEPLTELPKGMRKNPKSCPCGAATGLWVGATFWRYPDAPPLEGITPDDREQARLEDRVLPTPVSQFIYCFDRGDYPELAVD